MDKKIRIFNVYITCVSGAIHHFVVADQELVQIRNILNEISKSTGIKSAFFNVSGTDFQLHNVESIKSIEWT